MIKQKYSHGSLNQNGSPFIGLLAPFVGNKKPAILPFVGKKIPFVSFIGFTLIELIITLTIAGILAVLAVPGMNRFMESNRLTTLTNELIADINLARSEAIKRGAQTAICGSPTSPSCAGGATWNGGWLVFVDADNNGAWSANDIQIKTREAVPQNTRLTPQASTVVFTRMGGASAGSGTYEICNTKIKSKRDVTIDAVGRASVAEGTC